MQEYEDDAMEHFVSCNANDPAAIGRLQATVRFTRMFTSGEVKEKIVQEARENNG